LARDALPDPERSAYGGDVSQAPRFGLESELAAMWADVLGIKDIGRHDTFFEIGGDSMKVVALLARLSASHPQSQVDHLDFYRDPTVAGLAALLLERTPDYVHEALPILAGSGAGAPLTLLCVPYAGGSPAVYMPLADALQACMPGVCVRAVAALSSSDDEVGVTEIAQIADALMPQVLELDGDLVLYGHSAGSALAIALARRIEAAGRSLRLLVLGAVLPPTDGMRALPMHDPFADLDDDALRAEMASWGLAPGSIDEPSLANVLSGFRRDAGRALRYHLGPEATAVVAPVLTILGGDDPTTDDDRKRHLDWPFLIGDHRLRIISGGDHYFVQRLPAEVADVLDNTLADMSATTGEML
jgi:surfactin synthase thioesterase subunit/aryl carrier-like protein